MQCMHAAHKCDSGICISICQDITRVSHSVIQSHAVGPGLTAQITGTPSLLQEAHRSHFPIAQNPIIFQL